ncbi:SVEP1-like protein [Mya arenaria]|uniref:SVEP1-like protein n=1 Tax=Mya arenaria TaxID=6604 RepID=A0ABY7EC03_MYAAR|nr:SVEP1-like protein [Mya arenaria]
MSTRPTSVPAGYLRQGRHDIDFHIDMKLYMLAGLMAILTVLRQACGSGQTSASQNFPSIEPTLSTLRTPKMTTGCGDPRLISVTNTKPIEYIKGVTDTGDRALVTVTCNDGYEFVLRNTKMSLYHFICLGGHWRGPHGCKLKDCGYPTSVPNENVKYIEFHEPNKTTENSTVSVYCIEGYGFWIYDLRAYQAKFTMFCKNGNWTHSHSCKVKDCRDAPYIENGYPNVSNGTTYGSAVVYTCDDGYTLYGENRTECQADGTWKAVHVNCTINDCRDPPALKNGSPKKLNGTTYGSVAVYTCDDGYTLHGKNSTVCQANGTWKDFHVNCIINDCGDPTLVPNEHVRPIEFNKTTEHARVNVHCLDGYGFWIVNLLAYRTSFSMVCRNGKWMPLRSCQVIDCYSPPAIENGSLNKSNGTTYGSVVVYTCEEGYKMYGETSTYCQANGKWKAAHILIGCMALLFVDCNDPPVLENGSPNKSNGTTYGSVVVYSCGKGYTLYGDNSTTCQTDGTWKVIHANCTINDYLHTLSLSKALSPICNKGYTLYGDNTSECLASGQWEGFNLSCSINDCGPPTLPDHAIATTTNGTVYQSFALFNCDRGYTIHGDNKTLCLESGKWKQFNLSCSINANGNETAKITITKVIVFLKDIWMINIGHIDVDIAHRLPNKTNTNRNIIVKFPLRMLIEKILKSRKLLKNSSCFINKDLTRENQRVLMCVKRKMNDEVVQLGRFKVFTGYAIHGDNKTQCLASGKWKQFNLSCSINDCRDTPYIENGYPNVSNGTTYGSAVVYTCDDGYTLYGENRTECQADGTWKAVHVNCTINNCRDPPALKNGYPKKLNGTTYGSVAVYTCDDGYTLHGKNSTVCQANGTWKDFHVNCIINDCGDPTLVPNEHVRPIEFNKTTEHARVNVHCLDGYGFWIVNLLAYRTSFSMVCHNGKWIQSRSCQVIDCYSPPAIENGSLNKSNGTTYGSVVVYTCEEGYKMYGETSTYCQANGKWKAAHILIGCMALLFVDCNDPPVLENGSPNKSNGTTYGSVVVYSCGKGYTLYGDNSTTCQTDGTWKVIHANCTINDYLHTLSPSKALSPICNKGYTLYGDNTSECLASGQWEGFNLSCSINDCGPPTLPDHAIATTTNGTVYQSFALFNCDRGYTIHGDNKTLCLESGKWKQFNLSCSINANGNETAKITITKVIVFLKDIWMINIGNIDVDIAHRLPNKTNTNRNIIVKFPLRMLIEKILKCRKLLKNSS